MKKTILIGSILTSIIAGISIGIITHIYNDNVLEKGMLEELKNANKLIEAQSNIIQTTSNEEKTTPNTKLVYETLYLECNHTEVLTKNIENEDVNQDKEYFEKKYNDWKIEKFSNEEIKLSKEEKGICSKHYIVKEKDGYIAIYTMDSDGNENLKKVTDIITTYLPEEDIELLKKGIKVNGDIELAKTISDFE